ncbi:hypothetical protein EVG20_g5362 [Dentipellis fragilis]|uniref:Secreted protein n=1 Tax=Dentipellis fragilis TaxID=205917 RepID=A0A4Y9YVF4_9AGAM|nr:hypothetical protein EVG20_g5362 [Dentipellis fragilis]
MHPFIINVFVVILGVLHVVSAFTVPITSTVIVTSTVTPTAISSPGGCQCPTTVTVTVLTFLSFHASGPSDPTSVPSPSETSSLAL